MSYYDRDRMNETTRLNAGTMNHAYSHHGNVAEYQASGFPYVLTLNGAQDDTRVVFPYVTQWICVSGLSADAFIAFKAGSSDDTTDNAMKFCVQESANAGPPVFRFRCTEIYVTSTGSVSIAAGMTSVPKGDFPDISEIEGVKTALIDPASSTTQPSAQ